MSLPDDARGRTAPLRSPGARGPRVLAALLLWLASGLAGQAGTGGPRGPRSQLAIEPMTLVGPGGAGYFADPQPVHLAPANAAHVQVLSGTTRAILSCAFPLKPGCFSWTRISVDVGALGEDIAAAGDAVTNVQNIDVFQSDAGAWHAAVTIGLSTPAYPRHWTVVAHAHPSGPAADGSVPLAWSADTVLAGSLREPAPGNYGSKYVEDGGRLYLLSVQNVAPRPALRNAIVLQPMRSPTEPGPGAPVTLLTPGEGGADIASERYARTPAELVEAPNLARIGGKYALVYSTGSYLTAGYKAAVAWSDTLVPAPGERYRKVVEPGPDGLGGRADPPEVRYLVQSEDPRRPNFTGDQVIGPGVAAATQDPSGDWWLLFDGFAPGDMPLGPRGMVDGSHRRPFALRMRAAVPGGRPVAQATAAELAGWLTPALR